MQGTVEYNEKNYYFKNGYTSSITKFWYNLLSHLIKNDNSVGFFDESFIFSCDKVSEILAILTYTDLEFEKKKNDSKLENKNLTVKALQNSILFSKEIKE